MLHGMIVDEGIWKLCRKVCLYQWEGM